MQKVKRKSTESDASSPKKKKVQFDTSKDEVIEKVKNEGKGKKLVSKPKKDFKKGAKAPFNKPGFKGKNDSSKLGPKGNNKLSKNQEPGEKPKWSEMKKEKKNLRLERRKAKATAEVFEISHKAKLLAAQIQR